VLRYVADLDLASVAELLGIDVAVEADRIMLGAILSGEGELPLSGVAFEEVDERVPVTGPELPRRPRNLGFAES
jgi:hypothetical protein